MPFCLLAAGSNLGDSALLLGLAEDRLGHLPLTRVAAASNTMRTPPVGGPPDQGDFLNSCFLLETLLGPRRLLQSVRQIEEGLGRERRERWGPRPIDLDILLYDNLVIDLPELQIPHPRMSFRNFVLEPACEVAPHMQHPILGTTLIQLKAHLSKSDRYLAIAGPDDWELAQQLQQRQDVSVAIQLKPGDPESCSQLTALLRKARSQWVVTAGWCDQLLGPEPTQAQLATWSWLQQQAPVPRLVALIEQPDGALPWSRTVARRPHGIPLLALPAEDPHAQITEIAAALEAADIPRG